MLAPDTEKKFLATHHIVIQFAIYKFEDNRLIDTRILPIKPGSLSENAGVGQWVVSLQSGSIDEEKGVLDLDVNFRLKSSTSQ